MKRGIIILILVIIVAGIGAGLALRARNGQFSNKYKFAEIKRGNLERTISATGTLSAVHTVEVGTQVSGTIAHIYADFNDRVRKGQLLAVLDTSLLKAALIDARANYKKALAQLEEAQEEYNQNLPLFKKGIITRADFISVQTKLKIQEATVMSAEAVLKRAERNLKYAYIRSPIDGIVTERNIEEGQTVAASFATPTLFIIAEDLSKMQILAQVDESDIGEIKDGQKARFTVEAYPDRTFEGTVKQIRLQPVTIQNVVNYTVVVNSSNTEKLLLPGMTATIDFIVEQKKGVLLVPNSALRFKPSKEMIDIVRKKLEKKPKEKIGKEGRSVFRIGATPTNRISQHMGRLWYIARDGSLMMTVVRLGSTDGKMTEIVRGRNIKEGMKVIIGIGEAETKTVNKSSFSPPHRRLF